MIVAISININNVKIEIMKYILQTNFDFIRKYDENLVRNDNWVCIWCTSWLILLWRECGCGTDGISDVDWGNKAVGDGLNWIKNSIRYQIRST
jgi:hypothetical protein